MKKPASLISKHFKVNLFTFGYQDNSNPIKQIESDTNFESKWENKKFWILKKNHYFFFSGIIKPIFLKIIPTANFTYHKKWIKEFLQIWSVPDHKTEKLIRHKNAILKHENHHCQGTNWRESTRGVWTNRIGILKNASHKKFQK